MRGRRGGAPTPLWVGKRPPSPPQPSPHSFTDSDKEEAPPRPLRGSCARSQGSIRGWRPTPREIFWGRALGVPIQRASSGGKSWRGGGAPGPRDVEVDAVVDVAGRRGHSRLERVLNGGGHGPLHWAASGPGRRRYRRRRRCARAQPGLRHPLCRPARYEFIHSPGCGAEPRGRAGGGARPIPARPPGHDGRWSPGARGGAPGCPGRDYMSQGASGEPRADWLRGIRGVASEHPSRGPSQALLSNCPLQFSVLRAPVGVGGPWLRGYMSPLNI